MPAEMNDVRFSVLDQLDQLEEVVLEGSRLPSSTTSSSWSS